MSTEQDNFAGMTAQQKVKALILIDDIEAELKEMRS